MTTEEKPLLPVPNRLESFWLERRDNLLAHARTTADLPKEADLVVVGSGLAGAMASYLIMKEAIITDRPLNVVMLEADETTGAATARNGGHCKPITYLGYRRWKQKHGAEGANRMCEFEEKALQQYIDIVKREKIECDLTATRSFDCYFDDKMADNARLDFLERKKDHPEAVEKAGVYQVEDMKLLEDMTGVMGAKWSGSFLAGHLFPYLLATSLIHLCLKSGLNLQTHTPALGVSPSPSDSKKWDIKTPRGIITTKATVVASNAYTSSLLPEFKKLIIPVRATASAIKPPPNYTWGGKRGPIPYSFGFMHGVGDVDYMIARNGGSIPGHGDKTIIFGGAKSCYLPHHEQWYGNSNDNEEVPGVRKYFEGFMPKHFKDWDGDEKGNVLKVWTGVLGYCADFTPYIGPHPDRPGVFLLAGFNGHGMPRIPGCAHAIAPMVNSYLRTGKITEDAKARFDEALPPAYHLTRERMEAKTNVIKEYMGQGGGVTVQNDEAAMLAKVKIEE